MGFEPVTTAIPLQRSNQLSQQANWELVIWSVLYKPVKGKDESYEKEFESEDSDEGLA